MLLFFRISAQSTSCSLCESSLSTHSFVKTRYVPTEYMTELQSAVTMDRARPSYSAATTVTVETETCRLFFLSATEESLERVLTLCLFVAMPRLASQSLEHIVPTF